MYRRSLENGGRSSYEDPLTIRRKAANARERNIAKMYFSRPTLPNLIKAAYHYHNSIPWLGGEPENGNIYVKGDAPLPDIPAGGALAALQKVRQLKKARSARIAADYAAHQAEVISTGSNAGRTYGEASAIFENKQRRSYLQSLLERREAAQARRIKQGDMYNVEELNALGVENGSSIITGRGGNRWQPSNNYGGKRR